MGKGTDHFKETIQAKLNEMAEEDPLFAESLKKENKDIDECIRYIISQVQKSGRQGFTDDEIYGIAAHYYDEDDLENVPPANCNVVVNHIPELTEAEKQELREQARREVLEEERKRLHSRKKSAQNNKVWDEQQPSLF